MASVWGARKLWIENDKVRGSGLHRDENLVPQVDGREPECIVGSFTALTTDFIITVPHPYSTVVIQMFKCHLSPNIWKRFCKTLNFSFLFSLISAWGFLMWLSCTSGHTPYCQGSLEKGYWNNLTTFNELIKFSQSKVKFALCAVIGAISLYLTLFRLGTPTHYLVRGLATSPR